MRCWARFPNVVLGPSVLDNRVRTGPIVTHLGRLVHKLCLVRQNFGHMPMAGRAAMEEL